MKRIILNILPLVFLSAAPFVAAAQDNKASEAPKKAVVEYSANLMREEPDYSAELGDQALMGTVVEVLETSGSWVKIKSPEPYTAWVNGAGLVMMDEKELADYMEAPKYICVADVTRVYEEPSVKSRIVSELVLGDVTRIMYKIITHKSGQLKGYDEGRAVLKKKFVGVVLPSGKTGYVPAKDVEVFYKWAKDRKARLADETAIRKDLVETCMRFLGVPYMWGGTSIKNVDCSGLTRSVFHANGILLPRNASQQGRIGQPVQIFKNGQVDWSELLPGDLVLWGRKAQGDVPEKATHVSMYIGDGRFIHASGTVRISSLDRSAPDFYDREPLCARRVIGQVDVEGSGIRSIFNNPSYFSVSGQ